MPTGIVTGNYVSGSRVVDMGDRPGQHSERQHRDIRELSL